MMRFLIRSLVAAGALSLAVVVTAVSGPAASSLKIDNLHLAVANPTAAAQWYIAHLGATVAEQPTQVRFGPILIAFVKTTTAKASAGGVIEDFGLSIADLDKKVEELTAAGARLVTSAHDVPGLYRAASIEDPDGVKIEIVNDPEGVGFHHVRLRVPQPEQTLAWFEEMLGGRRAKLKNQVEGLRYGNVWLLAAASSASATPAPSGDRAIQSVGWLVPDITAAVSAFRDRHVASVAEPRSFAPQAYYTFVGGPDGIRVELLQRP